MKTKIVLLVIFILAASFRFYNLNWDQGHNLHPDERAIILTVFNLKIPNSTSEFLSPTSSWNPHFFAYGSFPMYLLYFASQIASKFDPSLASYDRIAIVGRLVSALADLMTVMMIFLMGKKIFNDQVGFLSAFFYAISVLPIQLSHFYAVDTLLTFFILTTLYQLIIFYEKPSIKRAVLIGFFFGLALVTKVSAIVLIAAIGAALVADFFLLFIKQPHKPKHWLPHLPGFLKHSLIYAFLILTTTFIIFIFFEPYAFIDFKNFWLQTMQQQAMTKDAFTFPYTLQYVGKVPYLYEIKNIFFFGLGPILAILSFIGVIYFIVIAINKYKNNKWAQKTIVLVFFFVYFFIVGNFAVGFMRYILPVYPLFCLFAALVASMVFKNLNQSVKNGFILNTFYIILTVILLIWPLSFIQIYNHNNTRVDATNWILKNISFGKTLAIEHWDDQLPLTGVENYKFEILTLYEPDTTQKWQTINQQLKQTDYIIIASNRLYAPLQKLTDCSKLPPYRCYTQTASYYQKLFSGQLGFQKVEEFANYPTIPFLNIKIDDQVADESFTVYDHPKIMIFKKNNI